MSRNKDRDEYVTKTGLKRDRGWTDRLIEKYLPEPDNTRVNIHYKSGPRVCLYRLDRVEQLEQQPDFVEQMQVAANAETSEERRPRHADAAVKK